MVFILLALWWIRGLWKLPDGRDWLWGKQCLVLMGGVMLSNSLIQFSVDGHGWMSVYLPPKSRCEKSLVSLIFIPMEDLRFPTQGLNLCPMHWEHGVLTTGPARKSTGLIILKQVTPKSLALSWRRVYTYIFLFSLFMSNIAYLVFLVCRLH